MIDLTRYSNTYSWLLLCTTPTRIRTHKELLYIAVDFFLHTELIRQYIKRFEVPLESMWLCTPFALRTILFDREPPCASRRIWLRASTEARLTTGLTFRTLRSSTRSTLPPKTYVTAKSHLRNIRPQTLRFSFHVFRL
jgi:hypothetical protein